MNNILERNDKLDFFFDSSSELIVIIDKDENFKRINKSWTKALGWTEEELLSMKWKNIIHKDDIESTNDFLIECEKYHSNRNIESRYISKDGHYRKFKWSYKYINNENMFLGIAKDITELKEHQIEKIEYEKIIQLESMKNEFFTNMSHEFKTPLNIILASMQLINKNINENKIISTKDIDLNKYMNSIKQNSYRLLRLVNNIIDMNRMDNGYYTINLSNQNIISVVEDITMSVTEYVNGKGIRLIFDTEVEEEIIACDPDKIERIILNLLSNAIKYTSKNGEIDVNIKINNNKLNIIISDNGIGIPEEKLEGIFNRYIQIDNGITRKWNGSGIGLSIVKSLVEMHNGNIFVESKVNEGSIFTIELPRRIVENKDIINTNTASVSKVEKCNIEFSDIYK